MHHDIHIDKIELHVHLHQEDGSDLAARILHLAKDLDTATKKLKRAVKTYNIPTKRSEGVNMSATSDAMAKLEAEVTEDTTVKESAITLLNGLSQFIKDNVGNPTALNDMANRLDAQSNALAAAIEANTVPTE